jgi:hypothetical protein
MDRWNRWGMRSKPGSEGLSGGRTRTTSELLAFARKEKKKIKKKKLEIVAVDSSKVGKNSPTLTDVRASSSDALLPPPALLPTLIRLLLLGAGRTIALKGLWAKFPGEAGGELAMTANPRPEWEDR